MKKGKILVIYHGDDNDGVLSGVMFGERFVKDYDIEYFGANYNNLKDFFAREDLDEYLSEFYMVCMTDISSNNPDDMVMLRDKFGKNFIWVDHHAPIINMSIERGFDDIDGLRDTTNAATVNMWKYLHGHTNEHKIDDHAVPLILHYLSGWDSWSWEKWGLSFESVQYVNTAITRFSNLDRAWFIENLSKFMCDTAESAKLTKDAYDRGKVIIEETDRSNKRMIDESGDDTWTVGDGRTACMVVLNGGSNSQMFKSVKDHIQHGIAFRRAKNGNWTVSLYNTNNQHDFHCGNYLKENYGGGGHEGAAGATFTLDAFVEILKKKHL